MTMHAVHKHEEGFLEDDCPRCAEHASNPLGELDNRMLSELMERVARRKDARSDTERRAMANVKLAMDSSGMLFQIEPEVMSQYVNSRWGVRLELQ